MFVCLCVCAYTRDVHLCGTLADVLFSPETSISRHVEVAFTRDTLALFILVIDFFTFPTLLLLEVSFLLGYYVSPLVLVKALLLALLSFLIILPLAILWL